jgi:lysyl-tRNA synthetase class 2
MPSRVISSFTYDPGARRLVVTFVTGRVYEYADVPADVAANLRASFSKGVFFNAHIRDRYEAREIVPSGRQQPSRSVSR